ncbi:hypothetical protein [Streptomyces sp. NPDC059929]|uniref:hypothetical protein n=1 Tax=Streptomyces sp. NPDC059929 TaxID=3347008 RepID=UPI00365AF5A7
MSERNPRPPPRPHRVSLPDLRDHLARTEWWDDQDFYAQGLYPEQFADLRAWALAWSVDLDPRLYAAEGPDEY